ncbi:MAG: peptide chain release factor 1 [Fervidobacterium sp.]|uniref:Peptide chain release factor 1 n=2 Tax=Fervidobacterium TaxID=2422 RepID=A0A1M7SB77_FERGO|nr:peptide chain release factor 1 [Fervidobacterium gondwanense]SHN55767.1 bacterial peptide chain release factor 1 (bRF-1) [Fervidobacterium gondwanense DSM 13020]
MESIRNWVNETLSELEKKLMENLELKDMIKVSSDFTKYKELGELINEYFNLLDEIELWREEPGSEDEISKLERKIEGLSNEILALLLPDDEFRDRNVFLEIRAGTGGEEAALFAGDLLRMYLRYAESKGWDTEILDESKSDLGGYKEVVIRIKGKNSGTYMKYERGVHRVQRVPVTESGGRIHTSTATVAVLPEIKDVDVYIDPKDLRIDTYRASGAGGQYVNKTESAIRITHIPTGIVVTCQSERSQLQNKERAMMVLRAKLYELARREQEEKMSSERKNQIGSGERSEKIRTYNFPQNRVTDHRINLTIYNLQAVLDGNLDLIIPKLMQYDIEEQLKGLGIIQEVEGE